MKRFFFTLCIVFMFCSMCFATYRTAKPITNIMQNVCGTLGIEVTQSVSGYDLIGDTVNFVFSGNQSEKLTIFHYETADTVWLKRKTSRAVEGKHFVLLHYLLSKYSPYDRKTYTILDYTPSSVIGERSFYVNDVVGDSMLRLTDLALQKIVLVYMHQLEGKLYLQSKRMTNRYSSIVGDSYYVCEYPNKICKNYSKKKISKLEVYITHERKVLIDTDIDFYRYRTRNQFINDSISEERYWEDYYRPRYVDYVVRVPDVKYDVKFSEITGYDHAQIAFLLRCKGAWVGQSIVDGELEEQEYIKENEMLSFMGTDTIRGDVYFICGARGCVFYIPSKSVDVKWTDYSEIFDRTTEYDYLDNLAAYNRASREIKNDFFEYMKAFEYRRHVRVVEEVNEQERQMQKYGVFISTLKLYSGDYYDIGLKLSVMNLSHKTIKYIEFTTSACNPVGDVVDTKTVKGIGPIPYGATGNYDFEDVWWSKVISSHKPKSMLITYMDGSTKRFSDAEIDKCVNRWHFEWKREIASGYSNLGTGVYNSVTGNVDTYPSIIF